MRTSIKALLCAVTIGVLTTACSNETNNDNAVDISKPINVEPLLTTANANIPISRAAIGATGFDADDTVGLYIAHAEGATTESPITSAIVPKNTRWMNGIFTDEPLYWQNISDVHTLYAYYPFSSNATADYKVPVSIKTDQNDASTAAADYEAADLLWGKHATAARQTISIDMQHRMSEVTVTLSAGIGYDNGTSLPGIIKVELLCPDGFSLGGMWNLADGNITADAANTGTTSVTAYKHIVGGNATYRAILLPGQVFTKGSGFIRVTTEDGTTYTYNLALTPDENLKTTPNTTYAFALKLNKMELTLGSFTISSWTKSSTEGDANMDI